MQRSQGQGIQFSLTHLFDNMIDGKTPTGMQPVHTRWGFHTTI